MPVLPLEADNAPSVADRDRQRAPADVRSWHLADEHDGAVERQLMALSRHSNPLNSCQLLTQSRLWGPALR